MATNDEGLDQVRQTWEAIGKTIKDGKVCDNCGEPLQWYILGMAAHRTYESCKNCKPQKP